MKKIWIVLAILVVLVVASGFVPHYETYWGQSCDFSFAVNDMVCKPMADTWLKDGWLIQLVRGW